MGVRRVLSVACAILLWPSLGTASECREQKNYQLVSLSLPMTTFIVADHPIMIASGIYKTEGAWGGPVATVFAQDHTKDWEIVANELVATPPFKPDHRHGRESQFLSFGIPHTGEDAIAHFIFLIKNDNSELLKIEVQRHQGVTPLVRSQVEFRVYRLAWNSDFDFFRFRPFLTFLSTQRYSSVDEAIELECAKLNLP